MSHVMRKPVYVMCEQQRRRSACASAQSDQRFVVRCLDSLIPLLAIAEISRLQLASAAEQAGLSLNWSQTPKTGFLVTWLIYTVCTNSVGSKKNAIMYRLALAFDFHWGDRYHFRMDQLKLCIVDFHISNINMIWALPRENLLLPYVNNKGTVWSASLLFAAYIVWYEPCQEKTCLCHMRTTKAQISLRIRAVWSVPLFSLPGYYNIFSFYIQISSL